jgi:hypothetical protein
VVIVAFLSHCFQIGLLPLNQETISFGNLDQSSTLINIAIGDPGVSRVPRFRQTGVGQILTDNRGAESVE